MPFITEPQTVDIKVGFVCDACQESYHFHDGHEPIKVDHTFGYNSPADMTTVKATLCETCWHGLLKAHVPGAHWEPARF